MKFHDKITPEGTRDVLFEECTVRQRTQDIILKGLCEKGFHPVMTPTMEFYDLFGTNRYFSQESMYKLIDAARPYPGPAPRLYHSHRAADSY